MEYRVGLVVVNNRQMRELNRKYRKEDRPTDVLSFALEEQISRGEMYLGEIVVSLDKAKSQAKERGIPLYEEFGELVKHGAMHLLGWDHE